MIGQTISHYRIVKSWAAVAWVWYLKPKTPRSAVTLPSNSFPTKWRRTGKRSNVFSARREQRLPSTIPTSATFTKSAKAMSSRFIAMEFLDGETLKHRIGADRRMEGSSDQGHRSAAGAAEGELLVRV